MAEVTTYYILDKFMVCKYPKNSEHKNNKIYAV